MLAERLKTRREAAGLSKYALHQYSGIGVATISDIESGTNRNPGVLTLGKLADTLGCSIDYLAGRTQELRLSRPARPRAGRSTTTELTLSTAGE